MTAPVRSSVGPDLIKSFARKWRVRVNYTFETESAWLAVGKRVPHRVVLKVFKEDEAAEPAYEALAAFGGRGAVVVIEREAAAVLMDQLTPATQLLELTLAGRDDEATEIVADLIDRLRARHVPKTLPTVQQWGTALGQYLVGTDQSIPRELASKAQRVFDSLSRTQNRLRVLHGDLHHYNVLYDKKRGWLAIDPKGLIGEVEYEVGSFLRNPIERPDLFATRSTILRRLRRFDSLLELNVDRALRWAFAQAILAAVWAVEDGVDSVQPFLLMAEAINPLIVD